MRTRFALSLVVVSALISGSGHAAICNSLFAVKIKQLGGLADCDAALLAQPVGLHCPASVTANGCASGVYNNVGTLQFDLGAGSLRAVWLPKCRNGTNSCPTPELRCYDGTRPMVYAEKAVGNLPSNDWVFFMGGEGGPCHGKACWAMYNGGHGPLHQATMSTWHPIATTYPELFKIGRGIMSALPGNPFSSFNRIQFKRCSDGASDAHEVIRTPHGRAPVFHDGSAIWEGLVNLFETAQVLDPNDPTDDLPPLANADHILLAANSDAVQWLVVNGDRIRSLFEFVAPQADVRIVVDGFFAPMLENEARYNANPFNNLFDGPFGNPVGAQLPLGDQLAGGKPTYGAEMYRPGGSIREDWDARGVELDQTCLNAHLARAPCYDHHHVLLNHLSTPFFIIADQRDKTIRKFLSLYARRGVHAEGVYRWAMPRYCRRVRDQGDDVANLYATASEMAPGGKDDESGAVVGWNPGLFLLRPDDPGHVHLGKGDKFFGPDFRMRQCNPGPVQTLSMAQALYGWLVNNTAVAAIDGGQAAGLHWVTFPHPCGSPQPCS